MPLSRTERWILCNQYLILEDLANQREDEQDAKFYASAREAVAHGYEREYSYFTQNIMDDPLSVEDCEEVVQIMAMFRAIRQTYEELADKSGIDEYDTKFQGFDGNEDTRRMTYARFYCETHDAFEEFVKTITFNSHDPTSLARYRRMLDQWMQCANRYKPSKEEVARITKAS